MLTLQSTASLCFSGVRCVRLECLMYWDQQSRWVQLRTGFVYLWKRDHREMWAYQSEAMFHRRTCVKVCPLSLLLSGVGHCYSVFLYAVSDCESKAHWIVQVLSTIFSSHRELHCIARIKITNVDWVYLLPHTPKKYQSQSQYALHHTSSLT
jgi:hypothetical protein